jgi:hypothetical protein
VATAARASVYAAGAVAFRLAPPVAGVLVVNDPNRLYFFRCMIVPGVHISFALKSSSVSSELGAFSGS